MNLHRSILIVDDDLGILTLLRRLVHDIRSGWDVRLAHDGEHGWDVFQRHPSILVITDHNMPGMSGLDLARRIRAEPDGSQVCILLITAYHTPQLEKAAHGLVDYYFAKPFDVDQFLLTIQEALAQYG